MLDYVLLVILFAPFLGAIGLIFVPNSQALQVRLVAALSAGICFVASWIMFFSFDPAKGGYQFVQRYEWSKELGIAFYLGVDGVGAPLVLASAILLFAGIFISLDLFFLYFFYEMSVIPMYLLLGVWGSHTKGYLAMTDPEGLKQRDSVGFFFMFPSNRKESPATNLTLFLSAGAV